MTEIPSNMIVSQICCSEHNEKICVFFTTPKQENNGKEMILVIDIPKQRLIVNFFEKRLGIKELYLDETKPEQDIVFFKHIERLFRVHLQTEDEVAKIENVPSTFDVLDLVEWKSSAELQFYLRLKGMDLLDSQVWKKFLLKTHFKLREKLVDGVLIDILSERPKMVQ